MTEANFITVEGTAVSGKLGMQFASDILQSELLAESLESEPFTTLFASTSAHDEPWAVSVDMPEPWSVWLTPMLSDEPVRRTTRGRGAEDAAVEHDPLEKANRDRVTLLSRQYAAKDFSEEERARLEIVTERVRRLLPAVTVAEYESLVQVLELVKQAQDTDADIRQQLGLIGKKNG